jgi:choline dehydrogenase
MNLLHGIRMSTAVTYLSAARGRPNLEIRPEVPVDRVFVARGRATGVQLAHPEELVEADAVVLAAGTTEVRGSSCAPGSGRPAF